MLIVPFKPEHATMIAVQDAQFGLLGKLSDNDLRDLARYPSFTVYGGGKPVCVGGVMPMWMGRGLTWALLSVDAGKHMVGLTRAVRRFLDGQSGRLEAAVDCDFLEGHRWARLLGFHLETERMEAYQLNGKDAAMYVRVQR